jgi:hypothetical protein
MDWLRQLSLAEPDATLLRQDLSVMERLNEQLKELDRWVATENRNDAMATTLQSLPGVGAFFAAVLALAKVSCFVISLSKFNKPGGVWSCLRRNASRSWIWKRPACRRRRPSQIFCSSVTSLTAR